MTVTLSARHLSHGFGTGKVRTQALRDVSLDLHAGEITVLMGPSGSGKSTLLAVLSALLHPDEGSVVALGESLGSLSERAREAFRREHCGFVFQGYNLFPALTASQQLEIVLEWGGRRPHRAASDFAREILAALGLAEKGRLRPQQLSGGEKQRVAVARALIKRPQLLFADEPTAALDWKHGVQVIELLRRAAHDDQATVLVVSHDPRLVPLADRVVHLEDGVLVEEAAAESAARGARSGVVPEGN